VIDAHSQDPLASPDAQVEFVAAMLRPSSYAALHTCAASIRCIETHISRVFLTGAHAYKVKKPLRLSFVDYSSPDRRAALCREELRLNQRHAPQLYLDVVPIAGTPAQPRVGDTSERPFEHALRMRQFDTSQELQHLVEAGSVSGDEVRQLAIDVARVHAAAHRGEPHLGEPRQTHAIALANFDDLEGIGTVATPTLLAALRAALQAAFTRVEPHMRSRHGRGCVRECHGDLHCGNVVRWQGRLLAFDGLEFDPRLRYIDLASDVAFLSMDLDVHGRGDLRRLWLQGWCDESGDFDALALLPYYEASRALVRGKVAALRTAQSGHAAARGAVENRYLDWALARLRECRPTLFVMAGLSGAGKSWFAQALAERTRALVVRSDVERKRLAGIEARAASNSPPDGGIYTPEFNARTYTRLLDCARAGLHGGLSMIVDAANLRRAERHAFLDLAHELDADVRVLSCEAPPEVLRERVSTRAKLGDDPSEATVTLLDRQPGYWEPLDARELASTRHVRTDDASDVARALEDMSSG
jgi:aminoglycoside phosphotransferase family enzyme/predicted kinase